MSRARESVPQLSPDKIVNVSLLLTEFTDKARQLNDIHRRNPALDEVSLITRVLALATPEANPDVMSAEIFDAMYITGLSHGFPSSLDRIEELVSDEQTQATVRDFWDATDTERAWFREALASIVDGRKGKVHELRRTLTDHMDGVVFVPDVEWTGRSLVERTRVYALRPMGALVYVVMLLLDEKRGHFKSLRQCKLDGCHRYFLSYSTGGRPPVYCCSEHRVLAASLTGAERTERWRKRKAKKRGKS